MKPTILKLCKDVSYFIRNHHTDITILLLITTLIGTITNYLLQPTKEELTFIPNLLQLNLQDIIKQLSIDQQHILIKLSIAHGVSNLFSNTFLFGTILTILHIPSTNQTHSLFEILNIIKKSIPLFPKLLLSLIIMNLLIEIGLTLAIVPGILFTIFFSITPIIIIADNASIAKSMYISTKISLNNVYLITPAILLWCLIKIAAILLLMQHCDIYKFINKILSDCISNILRTIITIYLYRLYMIVKNNLNY